MNRIATAKSQQSAKFGFRTLAVSLVLLFSWCGIQAFGWSDNDQHLPVPPALQIEGLPPITLDLVEKAGRYTYSRSAILQSWHPIRREMLVTTRFGETIQVHKVAMPQGDRQQITFFGDPVRYATYHPTDDKYLVFLKDKNGDERHQLYSLNLESNRISQLTADKEPVTNPV